MYFKIPTQFLQLQKRLKLERLKQELEQGSQQH
jgi:hypothetical protein